MIIAILGDSWDCVLRANCMLHRQTDLMTSNEWIWMFLSTLYISLFPPYIPEDYITYYPPTFIIIEGNNLSSSLHSCWSYSKNKNFSHIFSSMSERREETERPVLCPFLVPCPPFQPSSDQMSSWNAFKMEWPFYQAGFDCRSAQQRYIQLSTVNRRKTIKCFFKNSSKMFRPCFLSLC